MKTISALIILAAIACPVPAEVVTVRLRGQVSGVTDPDNSLNDTARAGDPALISITYDRNAPPNPNPQNTAAGFSTQVNLGLDLKVLTSGGPSWSLTSANAPEITLTLENNSIPTTGTRDDSLYLTPQTLTRPVRFTFAGQIVSNVSSLPTVSELSFASLITAQASNELGDTVFFVFDRFTFHGFPAVSTPVTAIGPLNFSITGSESSRTASFNIPFTSPGAFHRVEFSDDLVNWTPLVLIEGNGFQRNFSTFLGSLPSRFFRIADNWTEFDQINSNPP
ncbi:hypothetical protein HZ994_12995 [Akkermansiaceae bacterium]|nr:hypothetical protein HZ994_12995 [Akkermansiaceae bacterium]